MKLETGIRLAKKLKDVGGETAVAVAVVDELLRYEQDFEDLGYAGAQKKLSQKSRLLLGLGYSEFLADEDTDTGYVRAATKKRILLDMIGLDEKKLGDELERLCGE